MLRLARWIVISDWMRPATPNMASPLLKVCETLKSVRRSNIILGLGAVSGNTDFTTEGILDTTTTLDGAEAGAFDQAITKADPAMLMMSLATYQSIDPNNPAVFSSTIIDGHIRNALKYTGVVISDSMSAEALSSYDVSQLGVKLVEAGGDMSCIGQTDYVKPIVDGLNERAKSDPAFASKVTAAATRVMALKIKMGLA